MPYKDSNLLRILILLGREGALDKPTLIPTNQLASLLEISQQTASRWLEDLTSKEYIEKSQSTQGLHIKILDKGKSVLVKAYTDLQLIFHDIPTQIKGQLTKGLGEGGYYMSLEGYMAQFEKILSWRPYPGTMNLRLVTDEDADAFQRLLKTQSILIEGFFHEETKRTLGKVFLWKCTIAGAFENQKTEGAIVFPDRTHHHRLIIELLAPFNVREKWNLHDGETIVVRPFQNQNV